jgi:hypothetical protein
MPSTDSDVKTARGAPELPSAHPHNFASTQITASRHVLARAKAPSTGGARSALESTRPPGNPIGPRESARKLISVLQAQLIAGSRRHFWSPHFVPRAPAEVTTHTPFFSPIIMYRTPKSERTVNGDVLPDSRRSHSGCLGASL